MGRSQGSIAEMQLSGALIWEIFIGVLCKTFIHIFVKNDLMVNKKKKTAVGRNEADSTSSFPQLLPLAPA